MNIEKLFRPTRDILEQFVLRNQPFVLTGIVDGWACFNKWNTPAYLVDKIGEREIPVREIGYDVGEWLGKTSNIKFSTFVDSWNIAKKTGAEPTYYLASLPINKYFPELETDYVVPEIPREQGKSANLWIGVKGQVTPLHHDWSTGDPGMDGLHAIVSGKKLFRLYDPVENNLFIRRKPHWGLFHHAQVDIDKPDLDRFPEFANARSIDVVLEQGEMLFIPKLWWHYVRTLEPSISVNFWFQHMGSERLKCGRLWPVMEQYLEAVKGIQATEEKMTSLLMYFGEGYSQKRKPKPEEVRSYMDNPLKLLQLPKFINSFANATNNPQFKHMEESALFAKEITSRVRQWVDHRNNNINNTVHNSATTTTTPTTTTTTTS
ncbi:hypothetical protein SAMD00019534_055080 [Acytostelium subglobosum LB1]|uniref:hypothetical protein n=1 Tax=Acytostelium subglobosum LB1 TaxID=1410327 RepID=UPI0006450764|nr:hypothetical protein SAMD00019534_055080 [Acytostelium subglobosum LB1]GAM22333.1 hypothetical protein SAMD00019534_055080 [Acytostelium subglobosum LB1]|eukprot:XP_012754453.1 hypothetical protein SAMD00019534_055080 [Acytostelium subglobosum LB1]